MRAAVIGSGSRAALSPTGSASRRLIAASLDSIQLGAALALKPRAPRAQTYHAPTSKITSPISRAKRRTLIFELVAERDASRGFIPRVIHVGTSRPALFAALARWRGSHGRAAKDADTPRRLSIQIVHERVDLRTAPQINAGAEGTFRRGYPAQAEGLICLRRTHNLSVPPHRILMQAVAAAKPNT